MLSAFRRRDFIRATGHIARHRRCLIAHSIGHRIMMGRASGGSSHRGPRQRCEENAKQRYGCKETKYR
jgi:hypothetical protein